MTRAERLLHLLDALRQARGRVTAQDLAATLGVSLRTLYRDIATLRDQGAQIDGEAGVGYRMQPGFWLPPMHFSTDQLEALTLGMRWVAQQADPLLAQAARDALARIRSSLPADALVALDTSGLFSPTWQTAMPEAEPWLPLLRQAVRDERKLRLTYLDLKGKASERTVWPFALAFFPTTRVFAAWCETRQAFRHFRADRVQALTLLDEAMPRRRHALIRQWRDELGLQPVD